MKLAIWLNQQNNREPSEDSDQPGNPASLIRAFALVLNGHLRIHCFFMRTAKTGHTVILWFCYVFAQMFIAFSVC